MGKRRRAHAYSGERGIVESIRKAKERKRVDEALAIRKKGMKDLKNLAGELGQRL